MILYQHDNNVSVGMVTEFTQPAFDVLVGQMLGDVVHQQRADGPSIVTEKKTRKLFSEQRRLG